MPYADPVKRKQYQAEYRKNNREKKLEYGKNYREENKQKLIEYRKSDHHKKIARINQWKYYGLKDDLEMVWEIYQEAEQCLICDNKFKNSKDKHMNHCHTTGFFLNVICQKCNILEHNNSYWKNKI